ncbi:hypothetical protein P9112_010411 [Eukaryota sp. TZLM1-RC]
MFTTTTEPLPSVDISLLSQAYTYFNQKDYSDAEKYALAAYNSNPTSAPILVLLSAIYRKLDQFSQSIEYSKLCIQHHPTCVEAHVNLAQAYLLAGDIDTSSYTAMVAASLDPKSIRALRVLATSYVRRGNTDAAVAAYLAILAHQPDRPDARSNLGVLLMLRNERPAAESCFLSALSTDPDYIHALRNLGSLRKEHQNYSEAARLFQRATELDSTHVDSWVQLSDCLSRLGDLEHSIIALRKAIALSPRQPHLLCNLASLYISNKETFRAVECLREATKLDPNSGDTWNELGIAHMAHGDATSAVAAYCEALRVFPNHALAYNNLGTALQSSGKKEDAAACFEIATAHRPDLIIAWKNRAGVLKELGRFDEAIGCFEKSTRLLPNDAGLQLQLANTLKEAGRVGEAIECYRLCLEQLGVGFISENLEKGSGDDVKISPKISISAEAACNLASCYKDKGDIEDAIVYYKKALQLQPSFSAAFCQFLHCQQLMCNWKNQELEFEKLTKVVVAQIARKETPSIHPFHSVLYPLSLDLLKEIAKSYAQRIELNNQKLGLEPLIHEFEPLSWPITIGYLSADFGDLPLAHLVRSIPVLHDRSKFKVIAFASSPEDYSQYREDFRRSCDDFVEIHQMSSEEIVSIIKDHGVDILINLNGYLKGAREDIFALKPAKIQISLLGYPGTTGSSYIDYLVVDKVLVPPECRYGYTESLMILPASCYVNDHCQAFFDKALHLTTENSEKRSKLPRSYVNQLVKPLPFMNNTRNLNSLKRSTFNLPKDKIVLCNFNQLYKLDPKTFDTWCRILIQCPNTILVLLKFPKCGEKQLIERAKLNGLGDGRLLFLDVLPKSDHIIRSSFCDLFLDTTVTNAHHTGMDALWAGLPVITLPGQKLSARVGASLLTSMDLEELICESLEDYEKKVVYLVSNVEVLTQLKEKVRYQRLNSRLFDTLLWTRTFEKGLEMAVDLWNCRLDCRDLEVTPVEID